MCTCEEGSSRPDGNRAALAAATRSRSVTTPCVKLHALDGVMMMIDIILAVLWRKPCRSSRVAVVKDEDSDLLRSSEVCEARDVLSWGLRLQIYPCSALL